MVSFLNPPIALSSNSTNFDIFKRPASLNQEEYIDALLQDTDTLISYFFLPNGDKNYLKNYLSSISNNTTANFSHAYFECLQSLISLLSQIKSRMLDIQEAFLIKKWNNENQLFTLKSQDIQDIKSMFFATAKLLMFIKTIYPASKNDTKPHSSLAQKQLFIFNTNKTLCNEIEAIIKTIHDLVLKVIHVYL